MPYSYKPLAYLYILTIDRFYDGSSAASVSYFDLAALHTNNIDLCVATAFWEIETS